MQPNVSMDLIKEALQRRGLGGLGGGTTSPAASQLTQGGSSPMGAPQTQQSATPQPQSPQLTSQLPSGAGPTAAPQNGALKAGQQAQGPQFDPETRDLAKSLVQRLLKGL